MKKVTIFCQAAGDIKYTLSLYERYRRDVCVKVFLPPNQPCVDFVKGALGDAAVVLPESPEMTLRKPWRFLQGWLRCRRTYLAWFKGVDDTEVYFFSQEFDWYSLGFVYRLAKQGNQIIHYKHYSHDPHPARIRFKEWLLLKLHCFVCRAPLVYCRLGDHKEKHQRVLQLNTDGLAIEKMPARYDEAVFLKYAYPVSDAEQTLLWIDTPDVGGFFDYESKTRELLTSLTDAGWRLVVKPHPRLPVHPLFYDFDVQMMPAEIPGEFFPLEQFAGVVGCASSLLGHAGKNGIAWSVLRLYEWKNPQSYQYCQNLLDKASSSKVRYAETVEELMKHLESARNRRIF